ncbi:response regulator [Halomonas vilamensis]|uniref:Response regulator n=1 Tax=Vreelandella vilamensis TaxID=531309 RepID=A0ABU1H7T5_9GAMM|nr:HD domain-containing phosphohydrolase [Halomonas vilamensis]MDR5900360.1 response regulator [Halomonas vilamensis]
MADLDDDYIKTGRILVIDDEPANLKLMDRMLRAQGYLNLQLIADSREVVTHYQEEGASLILLDINMPHLDGFAVLEQLKALNDPLLPPVIMLTAQSDREFLLRALSLGARDYITKPFDRAELMMRVRNQLEVHLAQRLIQEQNTVLEERVRQRTEEVSRTRLQVVRRLGLAAEYRDEETGEHILRMSQCCALIARELGWDEAQCELMLLASPMHDIGKIGIPDRILLKPGKFEPEEWEIMKTHVTIGARMLEGDDSDLMRLAQDIALTHHEKWDGTGYPHGTAGEAIPLSGRIAAISDVFDALTSPRPYKRAWSVDEALTLIKENRGKHFDPTVVEAFFNVLPDILEVREHYRDSNEAS